MTGRAVSRASPTRSTTFSQHAGEIDRGRRRSACVTLAAALVGRRLLPRIPYLLTGMIAGSVFAYALARAGIAQVRDDRPAAFGAAAAVAARFLRRNLAHARTDRAGADA